MCDSQHRPVKATRASRGRRSLHRLGLRRTLHTSQSAYKYAFERSGDRHQLSKIDMSVTTGTRVRQRRGRHPLRQTEDVICSSWGLIPGGIDRIETFTVFLIFLQGVRPISQPLKPHAGPARPHPALWAPALPTWAQSPAHSTVRLPSLWPKPMICLRFFFTKWLPGSPSIAKLTSSLQYSLCGFCDYRKKRE